MDVADLIRRVVAPERSVDLCLDANLQARHDDLQRQLQVAGMAGPATTMADTAETGAAKRLAQQLQDLERQMREASVVFRMRGLSTYAKQQWQSEHPARKGVKEAFNPETAQSALIALCCVAIYPFGEDPEDHPSAADPIMTEPEARALLGKLGDGQAGLLWAAAYEATTGSSTVPFSVAASATLHELDS